MLVNGDLLDEGNETFFLNLTNPSNATISDGQGLGTITNDDGAPGLSVNDVTVTEGDSGTTNATFTVTLAPASGQNVSVDYATADGTATAPADYAATSGTLTFAPGQTTKTVTVPVVRRHARRARRDVHAQPLERGQRRDPRPTGLGTIVDDDPTPALSINDVTVTEPDTGTVERDVHGQSDGRELALDHRRLRDRERHGDRAGRLHRRLRHADLHARPDLEEVTVPVNGDLLDEANETFFVNLTNPSNATIADAQGLGTITDNDPAPSLSINDVTVTEGDTGTLNATSPSP